MLDMSYPVQSRSLDTISPIPKLYEVDLPGKQDRSGPCAEIALESLTGVKRNVWRSILEYRMKNGQLSNSSKSLQIWHALNNILGAEIRSARDGRTCKWDTQFRRWHTRGDPSFIRLSLSKFLFKHKFLEPGLYYLSVVRHAAALEIDEKRQWWVVDTGSPQRGLLKMDKSPVSKAYRGPYLNPNKMVNYFAPHFCG